MDPLNQHGDLGFKRSRLEFQERFMSVPTSIYKKNFGELRDQRNRQNVLEVMSEL